MPTIPSAWLSASCGSQDEWGAALQYPTFMMYEVKADERLHINISPIQISKSESHPPAPFSQVMFLTITPLHQELDKNCYTPSKPTATRAQYWRLCGYYNIWNMHPIVIISLGRLPHRLRFNTKGNKRKWLNRFGDAPTSETNSRKLNIQGIIKLAMLGHPESATGYLLLKCKTSFKQ